MYSFFFVPRKPKVFLNSYLRSLVFDVEQQEKSISKLEIELKELTDETTLEESVIKSSYDKIYELVLSKHPRFSEMMEVSNEDQALDHQLEMVGEEDGKLTAYLQSLKEMVEEQELELEHFNWMGVELEKIECNNRSNEKLANELRNNLAMLQASRAKEEELKKQPDNARDDNEAENQGDKMVDQTMVNFPRGPTAQSTPAIMSSLKGFVDTARVHKSMLDTLNHPTESPIKIRPPAFTSNSDALKSNDALNDLSHPNDSLKTPKQVSFHPSFESNRFQRRLLIDEDEPNTSPFKPPAPKEVAGPTRDSFEANRYQRRLLIDEDEPNTSPFKPSAPTREPSVLEDITKVDHGNMEVVPRETNAQIMSVGGNLGQNFGQDQRNMNYGAERGDKFDFFGGGNSNEKFFASGSGYESFQSNNYSSFNFEEFGSNNEQDTSAFGSFDM